MSNERKASTSAKILYRPFGLVGSIAGGLIASNVFKQVWKQAAPGDKPDPPGPLQTEYPLKKIMLAAVLQGAIYYAVKTLIDRGAATLFQKWFGEWPGD